MMPFLIYTKIMYKCDDDFWERVRKYKRDRGLITLNAAVTELLDTALKIHEESQKNSIIMKH